MVATQSAEVVELPWYGARKLYRGPAGTRVAKAAFVCVNGLCPCAGDELAQVGIRVRPGSRERAAGPEEAAADNPAPLLARRVNADPTTLLD